MVKMMWAETAKVDSEGNGVEFVAKNERRVSLNMAFLSVKNLLQFKAEIRVSLSEAMLQILTVEVTAEEVDQSLAPRHRLSHIVDELYTSSL